MNDLMQMTILDADKVCSVEPNYTSYQIYIPKNRILYVSFIEGNFYSESFQGDLNLKVEDGILKLKPHFRSHVTFS